jgi:hypothetical protein
MILIGCLIGIKPQVVAAQSVQTPPIYSTSEPSEVKRKLHAILARPEFVERPQHESDFEKALQDYSESIQKPWHSLTAWIEKLYDRIRNLFSIGGGVIGSTSYGFICLFIGACIVVGLFLLFRYIWAVRANRGRSAVQKSESFSLLESELDAALQRTAEEWLSEAILLANRNDYRAATRARFLGVLVELDASGLLEFSKSETNGDYLVGLALNSYPDVSSAFQRLVDDFEYLWYGEHIGEKPGYERYTHDCKLITDSIVKMYHPKAGKAGALVAG